MMDKNDGGPAFPHPALGNDAFQPSYDMSGMSLRDWFAATIVITGPMAGFDAETCERICGPAPDEDDVLETFMWQAKLMAAARYMIADAMIEARK